MYTGYVSFISVNKFCQNKRLLLLLLQEPHPHMRVPWLRLDVVRVDVEGHEAQGLKRGRVHDGHVIGGVDGKSGNIGARRAAHVRDTILIKEGILLRMNVQCNVIS